MSILPRRKPKKSKRKLSKKHKLRKLLRPAGFLVDKKARKRAKLNQGARAPWELFFVDEPARYDEQVGLYTDYESGRAVKVHVVPAPWSRVIMYSILWAFMIGVTKVVVFHTIGKPNWMMAHTPNEFERELGPDQP